MASHLSDDCIFCGIASRCRVIGGLGSIPSAKILETEHSLAFLDISPVSEGHTLVIPKYHAETILTLPDEYLSDIGPTLKKVAAATGAEQFNILQNNGELAFQHVGHVHFHVVPKPSATEGLIIALEDNWPIKAVTREQLAETAEKMKACLA